jgi:cytoskeletal protein RodZ
LSSILRALKKLDEDSMSREPGTGEQKQKIKMRRMVNRRTRSSRVTNRILFIVLVVLLVGAAAWIFINSTSSNKEPPMTKKQDATPKKPALTYLPQQAPTLKKELKTGSPGETPPPAVSGEKLNPSTNPAFPPGRLVQSDSRRVEDPVPPAAHQEVANQTNDQEELIKQPEHPELILNGVLWSDNPGRRVALINDRYLKEGDVIDGVSVVKIERKSVILQSDEKKWTLSVKK